MKNISFTVLLLSLQHGFYGKLVEQRPLSSSTALVAIPSLPRLVILNETVQIGLLSVDHGKSKNYSLIVGHLDGCMAVDILFSDGVVFYTNSEDHLVRVNVGSSQESKVVENLVFPTSGSISVEWITRKVYWYDSETNRIEVVNVDQLSPIRKVLISGNLHSVLGVAVDPLSSFLFFHNFANQHTIERAWLDGSNRVTLVHSNLSLPKSLTVDSKSKQLYWIDSDRKAIVSTDLDGAHFRVIVESVETAFVMAGLLIWSDIFDSGIFWCSEDCLHPKHLNFADLKPYALRVYEEEAQPYRENPCVANGGCSHFCFLIPVSPFKTCGCPTGVKLSNDGVTCRDGPEEILIVARGTDIRLLSLDTFDYSDSVLNVKGIRHAVAVDYDASERFVYWSDNDLKMIRRAKLDGSDEGDVVISELGICDGLVIDWVARNIYWTDDGTDRIEVARLDGSARRVIISTGLVHPRAIVVDPSRGYLLWSDWDESFPKIERSYLDGSSRRVLVEFSPKRWPNGLALDIEAGRVFWAEATAAVIESADLETGQNRRVVLSKNFGHIYGLSLLGDYVYWSDRDRRFLGRAHKVNGRDPTPLHEYMADVMGIKAAHATQLPASINECGQNNGNCSHLCLFRPTGRVCMCPVGWELATNGRTCNVPEAFLMFTERDNNDILRISLSNPKGNLDSLKLLNVSQPITLDYHYSSGKVYWTGRQADSHGGMVSRSFMNGSGIEVIVDGGIEHPEGLAIDWLAGNVYWSDSGHHVIEMADFMGRWRRIIVWKNTHPRSLVVHPIVGYLYWAEWLGHSRLERSELDGENRITLLKNVGRIFAITIDYAMGRLFWSEVDAPSIQSVDLNGGSRQMIVKERSMQPYVLTEYADRLYWANWRRQRIEICDKATGRNRSTLQIPLHYIINLVAVHALKQKGWNYCFLKKRQCENLYVSSPERQCRCACATHYTLGSDKKSCLPPNTFVLFSQGSTIRRMKIRDRQDTEEHPVMVFPFPDQMNAHSVQYDALNQTIYWLASKYSYSSEAGGYANVLRRAKDRGNKVVEEVKLSRSEVERPYDIAYEPFSQTLFWSCESTASVNATRLIRGEVKPLGGIVSDSDYTPRALAVYAKRRFLFLASIGYRAGIVLCQLDGSSCHFIVSDNIMRPEALIFDPHGNKVFWVDSKYKQLCGVDYKGRGRHTLVYDVDHPTGLAVFRQWLYFIDQGHKIEVVNKQTGTGREVLVERLPNLTSILAVESELTSAEIMRSPCLHMHCSHLCLLKSSGSSLFEAVCACPPSMVLQETNNCVPRVKCNTWEWPCNDGFQCIELTARCDGVTNCDDGSDESSGCYRCQPNEFECLQDHKCIPRLEYCDGKMDCLDGSDERCYCSDPSNQFYCKGPGGKDSKICIIRSWVCDGVKHCQDGNDELFCNNVHPSLKWGNDLKVPAQDPVTYVIVIIVGFGVSAIILLAMYFFCRRPTVANVQPVEIELVNRTTAQENGDPAKATTVEYRYRLGIGKGTVVDDLLLGRPELTGRSSSSTSEDNGIKIGVYIPPPPPSPVSVAGFSLSSRKGRGQAWQQDRSVRLYLHQSARASSRTSYRRHLSPPPPYAAYSLTSDEHSCRAADEDGGPNMPLLCCNRNPVPPPPSPRSSGSVASSGATLSGRSTLASGMGRHCKRKLCLRRIASPRNPPPSPDELSDASSARRRS
ncbi:hypothetical protein M514_00586 [Trichuris suis]|uniref:EGF-like domain-containing protein n=1 Tax=Trichuris suis TaxID=68888 RepID=A0A085MVJ1_9BILA|nr:hypothetical protein M513_00586 [Trichuris suis]KFD61237.1 hypothetical protein M514_00586 [Trichuris suis]